MTAKPAKGIRGCLIANQGDQGFVFRVFGETDPATGQREFTDYELAVDDLWIEVTSDYYSLYERESGEAGKPFLTYRTEQRP
jgi:hypothetical protein